MNSVFLNIYNCAWKPGFLKSSHTLLCVSDNDVVHIHQYCNLLQYYCTYIMYCVNIIHTMWYPLYHNTHHIVHSLSIANKVIHHKCPLYNLSYQYSPTHCYSYVQTHTYTHKHTKYCINNTYHIILWHLHLTILDEVVHSLMVTLISSILQSSFALLHTQ